MKRCPSCAEEVQDAAVKCRFCGEVFSAAPSTLLPEIAEAEIKLKTLLLNAPAYVRQLRQIWKAPMRFFRELNYAGKDSLKQGIAFMLQGVTLSFVILTAGWALPESIATFSATNLLLISGSRENLVNYSQRVQQVKDTLSPALAKEWVKQGELMLAVRILPEDRFQRMLQRLRDLSAKSPELLEQAIKGTLTFGPRFGGRAYMLSFFMGLDPRMGPMLQQTHQLVDIGPKYELKPHIDFLLRTMVFWSLTCYLVSLFMPVSEERKRSAFLIGSYIVGFLGPAIQFCTTLVNMYLAVVLPAYIVKASQLLVDPAGSDLGQVTSGVFPFENLGILVVNALIPLATAVIAMAALAAGLRKAYRIPKSRAWLAAAIGLGAGLGMTEGVDSLVVLLLAPTGLL